MSLGENPRLMASLCSEQEIQGRGRIADLADEVGALAEARLPALGRFGLGLAHLQKRVWDAVHKLSDRAGAAPGLRLTASPPAQNTCIASTHWVLHSDNRHPAAISNYQIMPMLHA